ncbi:dihydrofolate reductase family protein [Companilactobacillus mishanensis]|uniref:Dihydrofolate reductase n=1 Tax=Companilactobacillus mishanensis TaxID=2486008 RepID=A0ABW9P5P6_9LACO|nr:dihydrofolate reductase family protein [Companilactobacillus mishanensis]MQS44540.1 dihydrofolate reductase [Companilactobacillus mishanensis]MQS88778.1 dihydrofolate reductase [Companilactobacillus mishanensis]
MRKVIFFGAISMDGFLADKDYSLDWLFKYDSKLVTEKCYDPFIKNVGTTIMGRQTYNDLIKEVGKVPYDDMDNYILSHHALPVEYQQNNVIQTSGPVTDLVRKLKVSEGKDIWIVGGGKLVTELISTKLIDTLEIQIAPVILGDGQRLFESVDAPSQFKLQSAEQYGQFTDLVFQL